MVKLLKSKLHKATITDANLNYDGSITIDSELMARVGIHVHESVHVFDINNGNRFETYTIEGEPGSGIVCVNGAAARLVSPGDQIIIVAYTWCEEAAIRGHVPNVVVLDGHNRPRLDAGHLGSP